MDNKARPMDIYLMGIGGTGMGAFAGLLKQKGHHVSGSDNAVYSPMKEKLAEWQINYHAPYDGKNVPLKGDLIIIGNVIRRENPEAQVVIANNLAFDSFPKALNRLFLQNSLPIVATGTHGKTTCASLLAHTLFCAGRDPGFLIGGIPLNFGESFRVSGKAQSPFVVEGDEYDTAFFDKQPKFMHYDPHLLLITSLEFDHADIYKDLDAVINAFVNLLNTLKKDSLVAVNHDDLNIRTALKRADSPAKIISYGEHGVFSASHRRSDKMGIAMQVNLAGQHLGEIGLSLFGEHNEKNALGCYAVLYCYGLSHEEIALGFKSFAGVKRRLEEKRGAFGRILIDDFAHHPTAIKETIKAARQKYPDRKIVAIFEPRSATSCMKIFEKHFEQAFFTADEVIFAPLARNLAEQDRLDTNRIAHNLRRQGYYATAFHDHQELQCAVEEIDKEKILLFMSNGDFNGLLKKMVRP